ncbi:MAG: hypothetical protein K8S87_06580, partial [Planctomycetes bacterium]|nr:hypothetical protein [Planctomycetota bacterium]
WPVVDRNWGSPWRDIAYTNWGWKAPGGFVGGERRYKNGADAVPGEEKNEAEDDDEGDSDGPTWGEEETPKEDPSAEPDSIEKESKKLPAKANGKSLDDSLLRRESKPSQAQKTIIIRKKFPETSLWLTDVVTKDGVAEFSAKMPDAITTQKISIVATDKSGYIGLARKNIQIIQPVFVRSLLPAEMKLGDKITVQALIQNFSGAEITGKASLKSDTLGIPENSIVEIKIAKDESQIVDWTISAKSCGEHAYEVSFETDKFKDSEQKKIFVAPVGLPNVNVVKGSVKGKGSLTANLNIAENADYMIANINVSLPNVFPAIQAWWAYDVSPRFSPWMNAASVIMNAAMLDYLRKTETSADKINLIKAKLYQGASLLAATQMKNGAWGWWFLADATAPDSRGIVGGENLYYTVYVLRALAELRRVDFPVDDKVMLKAIEYILSKRDENGLWASKGAYFWETFNEATDWALSAEIFEVLTLARLRVPEAKKFDAEITKLKDKMLALLEKKTDEPMTVSAAIQGLIYFTKRQGKQVETEVIQQYIDYLIELKRTGHWEPHWYHAYGGTVELNARILELLADYDAKKYDGYLREGITYLMSTREAWGAWHNEIGTANAIRALLKTGAFSEESDDAYITIKVNGETLQKIKVDKDDPFLSAAKLRHIEITKLLKSGKNDITVEYSGKLTASVMVELKQWGVKTETLSTKVKVTRELPAKASIGQPVTVKTTIKTEKMLPMLVLRDTIPSNAVIDTESLIKLRKAGIIADFRVLGNTLELTLVKVSGELTFEYKIKGMYTGFAKYESMRIMNPGNNMLIAKTEIAEFVVE